MAKKLGNDYRLWIESATAGTYNEIKGQQELKINRSSTPVDTTTKDDFPYGTQAAGLKQLSLDFKCLPNLPDANGYTRFETLASGSNPVNFQIRKGGASGASPADVVFAASMYIGSCNTDFAMNSPVGYDGQLTLAAAPTTDQLA